MPIHTRSQRYAAKALECVDAIKAREAERDEWKSRADSFPVMVLQTGLAQAIGFLRAKSLGGKDKGYKPYLADLVAVLNAGGATPAQTGEEFQKSVIVLDLASYRQLTRETLTAAGWLKRFGQAYIDKKKPDPEGAES